MSIPDSAAYGPGKQYFLVDSEQLAQLILDLSPEIRLDCKRLEESIREMVNLDRARAGLDKPSGTLTLWPNKNKTSSSHPDMLGDGRIAGRSYRAAAWFSGEHNLKISVLPAERK
jgi:hypothetical protein